MYDILNGFLEIWFDITVYSLIDILSTYVTSLLRHGIAETAKATPMIMDKAVCWK